MLNTSFDTSAPLRNDDDIEAQVFSDLEAARQAAREKGKASVIVLQYPDNRTVFQRLRAWWHLRRQPAKVGQETNPVTPTTEPEWPGHWGTTKYL